MLLPMMGNVMVSILGIAGRCKGAGLWGLALVAALCATANAQYPTAPEIARGSIAIVLEDVGAVPLSSRTTSTYPPAINLANQLARINFLRSEPADAPGCRDRFFVCDLNRWLYIVDRSSGAFTTLMNFEEIFPKFDNNPGYAGGLVTFAFDPGYATNGRFYTVHTEDPTKPGPAGPITDSLPGLDLGGGYETTAAVNPPYGDVTRESVLVEWTDTNVEDDVFTGTARELIRIGFSGFIHPMGDLVFNPLAQPGDADYGNLYIANGDGAAGEQSDEQHPIPQMLTALQGKILRITPDLELHPDDPLSANGRYRIPATGADPNPFVSLSLPGVRPEIFAYGFRNPHRFAWDRVSNQLFVSDIGLGSWEEVNLVRKGMNYGYGDREGPEELLIGGPNHQRTGGRVEPPVDFPDPDELTVAGLEDPVTPTYPVAAYSHLDGDAISGGFVYRGRAVPALYGRFVFGDITTGRLFHCAVEALLTADDSDRQTRAVIEELQIVFEGRKRRMFDIAADAYSLRGGTYSNGALPGGCGGLLTRGVDMDGVAYGCGRADIRIAEDLDGELYVLSKSDGMIRKITGTAVPPQISTTMESPGILSLSWPAISGQTYRVESRSTLDAEPWPDLPSDVAADTSVMKTNVPVEPDSRFFRVRLLP